MPRISRRLPGPPRPKPKEEPQRKRETGAKHALLTLILIARHLHLETHETFLSYETIARESLTSVASSWRSVDALVRSRHLIKETGGRGKHDCNTYKFKPAMFADVAIEGETKTPEAVVSSGDHIPPPHPLTSSEAASELAARFAELLNQPQKYSAEKRKEWPQVFDKLLGNHS